MLNINNLISLYARTIGSEDATAKKNAENSSVDMLYSNFCVCEVQRI